MFKTCISKVCVDTLDCDKCSNHIPSICGSKGKPTLIDAPCKSITFVGVTNVTLPQFSDGIDLAEGIHAYDGNGKEVEFTYFPTSIDTSVVGDQVITYTASGVADNFAPHMCGKTALHIMQCDYGTAKAYRTITIEATDAVLCQSAVCESIVGCDY